MSGHVRCRRARRIRRDPPERGGAGACLAIMGISAKAVAAAMWCRGRDDRHHLAFIPMIGGGNTRRGSP